jgi:N utilization substance protein A
VEWSEDAETFISNALSVPQIVCVTLDENSPGGRTASVVVLDDQLSLAIGRSGQNARLAAKLTNWRVDIQGATEAALWALEQVNQTPDLLDVLRSTAALIPKLASIMRTHEEERYPYTTEEFHVIGRVVKAVREAIIARRDAERPGAQQARARQRAQRRAEAERVKAKETAQARVPRGAYKVPLTELDLPEKVYSHLISSGLKNVGEVMERMAVGDEGLLMLNGIGAKALRDIKQAVEESGLHLLDQGEGAEAPKPEPAAEPVIETAPAEEEAAEEAALEEPPAEEAVEEKGEEAAVEAAEEAEEPADEDQDEAPLEEAELEPESEEEAVDFSDIIEDFGEMVYEEEEEEEETFGEPRPAGKRRKSRKRRRRTVIYDDATGETIVMHRHRRNQNAWDEYGEDY